MANKHQSIVDGMAEIWKTHHIIGGRVEIIWEDFERVYGGHFDKLDEGTIKNMFNSFVAGVANIVDPQSSFNLKYMAASLSASEEITG